MNQIANMKGMEYYLVSTAHCYVRKCNGIPAKTGLDKWNYNLISPLGRSLFLHIFGLIKNVLVVIFNFSNE